MTFRDLIEHLDDLIELARLERFDVVAHELAIARVVMIATAPSTSHRSTDDPADLPGRCTAVSPGDGGCCVMPAGHAGDHFAASTAGRGRSAVERIELWS